MKFLLRNPFGSSAPFLYSLKTVTPYFCDLRKYLVSLKKLYMFLKAK